MTAGGAEKIKRGAGGKKCTAESSTDSICRWQSQGSMRQRAAMKADAMQGSNSPDAAAAAALTSSAAARRTKHRERHRHEAARQLKEQRLTLRKVRSRMRSRHWLHGTQQQHGVPAAAAAATQSSRGSSSHLVWCTARAVQT